MNKNYFKVYKSLAFQSFNTIVLILSLNMILAVFFWISDAFLNDQNKVDQRVLSHREKFSDPDAYTVMKPDEVKIFLDEQDVMGSIGFQYKAWVQFRNPEFQGTFLNTDRQGFRKTKAPRLSSGNPLKVFVFGNSTTFGYGVSDDYTIPSYLQTVLEQQYPDHSILVRNLGQGFYYSTQELMLLISLIKDNDIPDYVIFIDGGTDTHQLQFKQDQPNFTDTLRDLWNFRSKETNFQSKKNYTWIPMIRLIQIISRKLTASNPAGKSVNPDKEKPINNLSPGTKEEAYNPYYVLNRYRNNQKIIRSICYEYGIKCYFIWQPIPFYKYERSLHRNFPYPDEIPSNWPEVYKGMKSFSSSDFLYLGEFFEGVHDEVFVDDVHYNEKYNEKIAKEIAKLMKSNQKNLVTSSSNLNLKVSEAKVIMTREEIIRENRSEEVALAVQSLAGGNNDWEIISILLDELTLHPESAFRRHFIKTLSGTYFPGMRKLDGNRIISLGLTSDFWTIDLKPAHLLVKALPDQNLSQDLWIACNADSETFPLTVLILGDFLRIEYTFKQPDRVKLVLPEIPAGEARLFTITTDKSWSPTGKDSRMLGVQVSISK